VRGVEQPRVDYYHPVETFGAPESVPETAVEPFDHEGVAGVWVEDDAYDETVVD
jgi:hypothetical protein